MRSVLSRSMEAELGGLFFNCQRGVATRTSLMEMGYNQPPTPLVTDSATRDVFSNDKIRQRRSRSIDMRFYWVRDRVRQRQFLVYLMTGEHNLADYCTKHHSTSHRQSQRIIYLVPTSDAIKYAC